MINILITLPPKKNRNIILHYKSVRLDDTRVEILIQARKSYLNWKRRWPYMKVFVGHKFILMASARKALEATALPSNVKIPNLASRTRLQKYSNLRNKIFGSYILYLIIEFL